MITKNPMQLKAYIKEKAAEKHISAQLVMQNYMLERLLERISLSPYRASEIHCFTYFTARLSLYLIGGFEYKFKKCSFYI